MPKLSKSSDTRTWKTVNPNASLPPVESVLPSQSGGANLPNSSDITIPDSGAGVSISTPFSNREDYETRLSAERDSAQSRLDKIENAKRESISNRFNPAIEGAEQYREDVTRSTKGQFGTDRRLSTAALTFVDERRGNAQKQVNDLMSQKETALANLDVEMADRLEKDIKAWQDNERYWISHEETIKQQDFENNFREKEYDRLVDKDEKEEKRQEDEQKRENFRDLVDVGYDFGQLSDEEKADFGQLYGVNAEAAGGVFDTIKKATEAAKANDEVEKMKNIYDYLSMVPEGTEVTIEDKKYTGMKSNNENIQNYESIEGGRRYLNSIDKRTGKPLYDKIDMGMAYKPTAGKVISLSEAISLGDPSLAGKPYSDIPSDLDIPDPDEAKTFEAYEKEAAELKGQLSAGLISWAYAYDYLNGKYGAPSDILDSDLDKDANYEKVGGGTKGKRDEAFMKVGG